jgi:hypothetical protein
VFAPSLPSVVWLVAPSARDVKVGSPVVGAGVLSVGCDDGLVVGVGVGLVLGAGVGPPVGCAVGTWEVGVGVVLDGLSVGDGEGRGVVGVGVGKAVGLGVGIWVGAAVGGVVVGASVGATVVGARDGTRVGVRVGLRVGLRVGVRVGLRDVGLAVRLRRSAKLWQSWGSVTTMARMRRVAIVGTAGREGSIMIALDRRATLEHVTGRLAFTSPCW